MEDKVPKYVGTAITGLLMGIGIGFLFAPQSGRRTRKDIEKWGRKTREYAWDLHENLKDNTNELIEDLSEMAWMNLKKGIKIADAKKNHWFGVVKTLGNGSKRSARGAL